MSQRCLSGRSGPGRIVRSVCALALVGAVTLTLPATPVHAAPEPEPAAAGETATAGEALTAGEAADPGDTAASDTTGPDSTDSGDGSPAAS